MSVPSIINKTRHVYSGVTRTFDFSFRIVSQSDLQVTVDTVPLTLGTHYTVDGVNFYTGGKITIVSSYPLVSGAQILIQRKIASFTQDTIFRNQGAFYADTVEDALDKLTMMSQELNSKISLLPTYPDTDLNVDLAFPAPTANGIFRWATRQIGTPASTQYYITASTLSAADITTGTLPIARGGTGQDTQQGAINSLVGTHTAGQYLRSNGTNVEMSGLLAADISGVVAISAGGTGATTASAALIALGVPTAGTASPANLAASAAAGTSTQWARADHVHARPTLSELNAAGRGANTDITSVALTSGTVSTTPASNNDIANKAYVDGLASSTAPAALAASAAVGTSTRWARADHAHARPTLAELGAAASGTNTDITSVALTSGTVSTTPTSGTNIANKAYVDGLASSTTPAALATSAAVGTSTQWARADHVHARPTLADLNAAGRGFNTDITSVALTSGTVSTAPVSSNDIANKGYVDGLASTITPSALGLASVGISTRWARADHVHARPTITELGAAASGTNTDITSVALTAGTISSAPISGTNIANKAYVDSLGSSIFPSALGVSSSIGVSTQWARADHVHIRPTLSELNAAGRGANTDITSVALTSGTISTTPTSGTNIANKAYVDGLASSTTPAALAASAAVGTSTQWARADHVHARPTIAELGAAARGANTDITSVALTSGTVSTAPVSSNDIVNKAYVDAAAKGINFHNAVNFATTSDLGAVTYNNGSSGVGATLTKASSFSTLSIDGQSPAVGDRVLVKNQTTGAQNGIYVVTSVGSASVGWVLTRANDYDVAGSGTDEINQGDFILVIAGTVNGLTSWVLQSSGPFTIGTTSLTFVQFSAGSNVYTAGTGLSLSSYQFSVSLIPIGNGGTGATTRQGAINALAGAVTAGQYLRGDGSNVSMSELSTADLVGTLPISKGGTGATTRQGAINALAGTATAGQYLRGDGSNIGMSELSTADLVGTLPFSKGGTGATTRQGAINALAGTVTSGQYLRGDGSNIGMSELSAADLVGTLPISKGGTGATTAAAAWTNIGANLGATTAPELVGNGLSGTSQPGTSAFWARADHTHRIAQIPDNRVPGEALLRSDIWNDVMTTVTGSGPGAFRRDRFMVAGIAGYPIEYNVQQMFDAGTLTMSAPANLQTLQFQTTTTFPNGVWKFVDFPTSGGGGGTISLSGDVTGNSTSTEVRGVYGYPINISDLRDNSLLTFDYEANEFKTSTKIIDWLGYGFTNPSINIGEGALINAAPSSSNFSNIYAAVSYSPKQTIEIKSARGAIYVFGSGALMQWTTTVGSPTITANGGNVMVFDGDINIIGCAAYSLNAYFGGVNPKIISYTSNSITFDRSATIASSTRTVSLNSNSFRVISANYDYYSNNVFLGTASFSTRAYSSVFVNLSTSASIRYISTTKYYVEETDLDQFGSPESFDLTVTVFDGTNTAVGLSAGAEITTGTGNVFVGANSNATSAYPTSSNNVTIGDDATVGGNSNTVVGQYAGALTTGASVFGATAIGYSSFAGANEAIAIGDSQATALNSIAIGPQAYAVGEYSVAVGNYSYANANSIAIGKDAKTSESISIGVSAGNQLRSTKDSICIGTQAQGSFGRISIGKNSDLSVVIDYTQSPRQQLVATAASGSNVLAVLGDDTSSYPYSMMGISGTGIPTNTIITSVDVASKLVYLSAPTTAAITSATAITLTHAFDFATDGTVYGNTCVKNCTATSGSSILSIHNTALQSTEGIKVYATVTGTGIAANTRVETFDGSTITLSAPTTAAITNGAITFNSALSLTGTTAIGSPVVRYSGLVAPIIGSAISSALGGIPAGSKVINYWQDPSAVINNVDTPSTFVQFSRSATSAASAASFCQRVDYKQFLSASISSAQAYGANISVSSTTNIRAGDIVVVQQTGRPIQISSGTIVRTGGSSSTSNGNWITFTSTVAGLIAGLTVSGTGVPTGTTVTAVSPETKTIFLSANMTAVASGSYTFTTTNLQACAGYSGLSWNEAEVLCVNSSTEITLSKNVTLPLANVDIVVQPKQPGGVSLGNNAFSAANELALGDIRMVNGLPATPSVISAIPLIVNGREGLIPVYAR